MKLSCVIAIILTTTAATAFISPSVTITRAKHLSSSSSKWDNLVDEDEDDDDEYLLNEHFVNPDMRYERGNVQRQNRHFVDIRNVGGAKEVTNDVYVRQPKSNVFWFIGKIARVDGVSIPECVARQYPLIAQHAANLRPLEMYPHRDERFEFWIAPGDSEMDVAYNKPDLQFTKIVIDDALAESSMEVRNIMVGFQGEMYEGGEEGFRTWRDEDGYPLKPEIKGPNTGEETKPKDFNNLMEQIEGMDAQKLWEEQEKREGRSVADT